VVDGVVDDVAGDVAGDVARGGGREAGGGSREGRPLEHAAIRLPTPRGTELPAAATGGSLPGPSGVVHPYLLPGTTTGGIACDRIEFGIPNEEGGFQVGPLPPDGWGLSQGRPRSAPPPAPPARRAERRQAGFGDTEIALHESKSKSLAGYHRRPGSAWGLRPGMATQLESSSGGVSVVPLGEDHRGGIRGDHVRDLGQRCTNGSSMRGGRSHFATQQEAMRQAKVQFYKAYGGGMEAPGKAGTGVPGPELPGFAGDEPRMLGPKGASKIRTARHKAIKEGANTVTKARYQ